MTDMPITHPVVLISLPNNQKVLANRNDKIMAEILKPIQNSTRIFKNHGAFRLHKDSQHIRAFLPSNIKSIECNFENNHKKIPAKNDKTIIQRTKKRQLTITFKNYVQNNDQERSSSAPSVAQPERIDSLRFHMANLKRQQRETTALPSSNYRSPNANTLKKVRIGDYLIDTWYLSPFPLEYQDQSTLYVCEFCFKYISTALTYNRHKQKCHHRHPPGNEIYRQGQISIFEVDGYKNKLYCQNLCLFTKLFLNHKTLFYDVEPFLFYIMTEVDQHGCHFVGYFSKEKKRAASPHNVSCILILPVHQRKGYGQYLIDFSYLLTRVENDIGTPEKPLSSLGAICYQRYWKYTLYKHLLDLVQDESISHISVQDLSSKTSMTPDDVISTLQLNDMIKVGGNQLCFINTNKEQLKSYIARTEAKGNLVQVDAQRLFWSPVLLDNNQHLV